LVGFITGAVSSFIVPLELN